MGRAADIAMVMVNRSIALALEHGDESYYMDFVKLHKLMYLAQCSMLAQFEQNMFSEKITARQCGPYVEGLHFIPHKRGFGKITMPFQDREFVRPSYRRIKVINQVLEEFGQLETEDLIQYTKGSPAYCAVEDRIEEHSWPEISPGAMSQSVNQSVG